jgi:hypothetical protein
MKKSYIILTDEELKELTEVEKAHYKAYIRENVPEEDYLLEKMTEHAIKKSIERQSEKNITKGKK